MHIGCDPKGQDAQSENTEEQPADKAEMQAEQAPFVALHQLHRIFARGVCAHLRVVRKDKPAHRIGICFDDAWYDKQQGPQHRKDRDQQVQRQR